MNRDDERMESRRPAFVRDREVFRDLEPGKPVRVLWVSGGYEPYDGGQVKKVIIARCRDAAKFKRGGLWEIEVETVGEKSIRYATLILRDEDDMPRTDAGQVDHSRCGCPNVVLLVWRGGRRPDGPPTAGGWVHLERDDGPLAEPTVVAPVERAEPPPPSQARVAAYLRWWERRPSRWLAMIRDDHGEHDLPDLPGARLSEPDGQAWEVAVDQGLLAWDPRPDTGAWQLTGRGLCFVHEHYRDPAPEPAQLELF